jgi:hypothetical protein
MAGQISRTLRRGSKALARGSRWLDRQSKLQQRPGGLYRQYPAKLNVGCGYDKREGYLNVDMDPACAPDLLIVDGDYSAIPRRYFAEVLAKDVLEHVPRAETPAALLDFADYLMDEGKLIVQTSSILHVAAKLQVSNHYADHYGWTICLFGNQQHPGDYHHTGFTDLTLQVQLLSAGFTIEALELREEWMFYVEARKASDWTSLAESSHGFSDLEFLQRGFQAALYRDIDEDSLLHWGKALRHGVLRRQVLKHLFSAPERQFKIAEQHKNQIRHLS